MKKILSILSMSVCVMFVMGCGGNSDSDEEVYELNVNNWNASTHHFAENVFEPWKELVEDKTDGRVEVNIHHGSSLGSASSVYEDVEGGLYEMSLLVTTYADDTDFFPYTIGSLPFAFENPKDASKIMTEFAEEFVDISDVIVLDPTSTDPYDIFSTSKIEGIEDLKGKKIRVNGKNDTPFVEELGGVPVNMAGDEIYEALEKGAMDSMFYTSIGGVGNRFFEPAPYISELGAISVPMVPIMNKEFYDDLPDDIRQMFEEEFNEELTNLFNETYSTELEDSHETLKEEVEGRGEFVELSDEVVEDFQEAGEVSWEEWVEEANSQGYDGDAMLDFFIEELEENDYPLPF